MVTSAFLVTSKQQQLIDAAHQLSLEQGCCQFSYRQVAEKAGLQLSNCYRHFESLSAVLQRLLAQRLQLAIDGDQMYPFDRDVTVGKLVAHRSKALQSHFNSNNLDAEILLSPCALTVVFEKSSTDFSVVGFLAELVFFALLKRFQLPAEAREVFERMVTVSWPLWVHYYSRDKKITDRAIDDIIQHQIGYFSYFMSSKLPVKDGLKGVLPSA